MQISTWAWFVRNVHGGIDGWEDCEGSVCFKECLGFNIVDVN